MTSCQRVDTGHQVNGPHFLLATPTSWKWDIPPSPVTKGPKQGDGKCYKYLNNSLHLKKEAGIIELKSIFISREAKIWVVQHL